MRGKTKKCFYPTVQTKGAVQALVCEKYGVHLVARY